MHRSRLPIAASCDADWTKMRRLGRAERHCSQCRQTVVNLSELTREEATRFLARRSRECLRYGYSASSGEIVFRPAHAASARSIAAVGTLLSLAACAPGEPVSQVDAAPVSTTDAQAPGVPDASLCVATQAPRVSTPVAADQSGAPMSALSPSGASNWALASMEAPSTSPPAQRDDRSEHPDVMFYMGI